MSIQLTQARQVALHDRSSESVRFGDDAIQTRTSRGPGWFRSAETARQNQAEFANFLDVLKADPNYEDVNGIAEQAFAAIRQHASTGKPLTSRMMAQAYNAGDAALRKFQNARAQQRDEFTQGAIRLANTPKLLDQAVARATAGRVANLSRTVPPEVLKEIKADVIDSIRQEIRQRSADGTLGKPRLKDINQMLQAAAARHVDRIETMAAPGAAALVKIDSLGTERLKPVLDLVQDFSTRRLEARLLSSAGANEHFEQNVMNDMGRKLAALDNTALLGVYRTTLSSDMLEFRLALANRPDDPRAQSLLQDLNSWEGMVNMELAERSLAGLPDSGPKAQLSGGHLDALATVDRAAAKKDLVQQSDDYLKGKDGAAHTEDPAAVRRLQGKSIDVPQLTQVLRGADLTINLPRELFDPGGPFINQDGTIKEEGLQLKNIFELPSGVKGEAYLDRRAIIEHSQVPGLKEREKSGLDPSLHPISASLNAGRLAGGAAPRYGWAFLALNDQVKERSTFTPTDSFYSFESTLNQDNIAQCKHGLAQLLQDGSKMSQQGREALRNEPDLLPKIFERLDGAAGRSFGLGHPKTLEDFFYDELTKDIGGGLSEADTDQIWNVVLDSFIDRSREASRVTSFEHLSQAIGDLQGPDVIAKLETAAKDSERVNLHVEKYVEAQVFGGIDLRKDVKAIHFIDIPEDEAPPGYDEQRANIENLAKTLNVPLVLFKQDDTRITRLNTDESVKATFPKLDSESVSSKVNTLDSFKKDELPTILDQYKAHEQTFDPTGIHGRRHISRALIYSNVLANVLREKGAKIDSYALYTTTAFHDSGREGNGVDRWEKESSANAVAHMKQRGIDDPDYLKFGAASINSESPKSQKSLEGGILKSADSLDIIRVFGKDGFRKDLLWFMFQDTRIGEDQYVKADPALRDKLIDEIALFIEATEPRTPSEVELDRVTAEFNQVNQTLATLDPTHPKAGALNDQMEDLSTQMKDLKGRVAEEHRVMNAKLDSGELFASIEQELLRHPEKYPTLAAYYDPSK